SAGRTSPPAGDAGGGAARPVPDGGRRADRHPRAAVQPAVRHPGRDLGAGVDAQLVQHVRGETISRLPICRSVRPAATRTACGRYRLVCQVPVSWVVTGAGTGERGWSVPSVRSRGWEGAVAAKGRPVRSRVQASRSSVRLTATRTTLAGLPLARR